MKTKTYKSAKDFAKDFGLSDIEIALINEKKKLIEKLIAERGKLKLSQAAVAKLIASKQPAIARMESGQISEVSMDFLLKVAFALQVNISMKPKKIG